MYKALLLCAILLVTVNADSYEETYIKGLADNEFGRTIL